MKDDLQDVDQIELTQEKPTEEVEVDGVEIGFGDETPEPSEQAREEGAADESAPEFIATLRKKAREADRLRKERDQLAKALDDAKKPKAPEVEPLGDEPTIEQYDWDQAKLKAAYAEWLEKKRVHDAKAQEAKAAQEAEVNEYQAKVEAFNAGKSKIAVSDYADAEKTVLDAIGQDRLAGLIALTAKPVELVYALGKSEAKLKQLAAEKNPAKFVYAIAQMEAQLKVTQKSKPATPPEGKVTGISGGAGALTSQIEAARAAAEKSGDFSEVYRLRKLAKQAK